MTNEPEPNELAPRTEEQPPIPPLAPALLFQPPTPTVLPSRPASTPAPQAPGTEQAEEEDGGPRRRRTGRSRQRRAEGEAEGEDTTSTDSVADDEQVQEVSDDDQSEESGAGTRRRRRRRRAGSDTEQTQPSPDDPPQTVVKVRQPRRRVSVGSSGGEASRPTRTARGSTRLEAKRQRRRDGRDFTRRRATIISEAEFLARREAVERVMVVRQVEDRTQIGVLEDGILVEHYVNRHSATSFVGNVYLGSVQNVLPSMEAAFVDIGKARNAVLYAGEVNWDAAGLEGQPKRIEQALKSGESVRVQVTKDPIGHKGARLTSQVSLPGRFLVYVPNGEMTGISRKLPDGERARLKSILRQIVPEGAGVIVRTAAEGANEEELQRDIDRLSKQWEAITSKASAVAAPALLHSEPDLTTRVIRDIFNEDFTQLVVSGDKAWADVAPYVESVAPDLRERVIQWQGEGDVFAHYRVDEQLAKALERTINLPSGGSLVIDRTEAMVVIDVNTGRFTGRGGNLEETVTKNNLEAAEEIVRQMRLRDLGGIIVVDFIDMVLESNRELLLRRLLECLGRDRTKHQVAEVTSLGLVQMTRKRVGQGLLEAYSQPCTTCAGRGVILSNDAQGHPVPIPVRERTSEASVASSRGSSSSGAHSHGHAHSTSHTSTAKVVHSGLPPEVLAKMPTPRAKRRAAKGKEELAREPAQQSGQANEGPKHPTASVQSVATGATSPELAPTPEPTGAPAVVSAPAMRPTRRRRAVRPAGSALPASTAQPASPTSEQESPQ